MKILLLFNDLNKSGIVKSSPVVLVIIWSHVLVVNLERSEVVNLTGFCSHGLAYNGKLYLIPINKIVHDISDLNQCIDIEYILSIIQRNVKTIIIIDAPADNLFKDRFTHFNFETNVPENTIITISSSYGGYATEKKYKESTYGVFTYELINSIIFNYELSFKSNFDKAKVKVQETSPVQVPIFCASISLQDYYFYPEILRSKLTNGKYQNKDLKSIKTKASNIYYFVIFVFALFIVSYSIILKSPIKRLLKKNKLKKDIFISYRREDSAGYTISLYEKLIKTFGPRVFKDVDDIPLGKDFRKVIRENVVSCSIVLVIIGKHWMRITDKNGNIRINDPHDLVNIEISESINIGKIVIPVLVSNAIMPNSDNLPENLKSLTHFNAIELRDGNWNSDLDKLVKELNKILDNEQLKY
ncbi:MAG: toll/interleukin-1 receptor domain-containing protein [Saprospiraceae bacterium]|nr:toll/interleukin-1 receptor domain-containing protein [Saprospiraceae bacterium]